MPRYRVASELLTVSLLVVAGIHFSNNMGAPVWMGIGQGLSLYGMTVLIRIIAGRINRS